MKIKLKLLYVAIVATGYLSAQDKWDTDGNNLPANNKLGSKNNYDVNIFTNNIKRGEFTKNGKFNFFGAIKADTIKADSLIINGGARIKGRLHVGQNSLWIGGNPNSGTDDITSSVGVINFGGEASAALPFSQIRIGMGTTLPQFNLHVVDNRTPSNLVRGAFANATTGQTASDGFLIGIFGNGRANLHQQETNLPITITTTGGFVGVSNTNLLFNPTSLFHVSDGANQTDMQVTNNATGNTATDGFKFGITNTGIGQVKQQENLPLQFHTNNTQRAVILANGRYGINNTNPLNRFVVTSAAADFGGGNVATPGGSSGIRTTNMTSATPTLAGNGKVVTVNANGDFYLAPDGGGSGPAVVTAQNGLNTTFASPAVELGGTLLHNTDIDMASNFDMAWFNKGRHIFQDANSTIMPTNPYVPKMYVESNNFAGGFYVLTNLPATLLGTTYGQVARNTTKNGTFNFGSLIEADGDDFVIGVQATGNTSSSTAPCYGVQGITNGGQISSAGDFLAQGNVATTLRTFGVKGEAVNGAVDATGVFGSVNGVSAVKRGVFGIVNAATTNEVGYGVYGDASTGNSASILPNTTIYGVYGKAAYAVDNYGVYGTINAGQGTNAYGVFGDVTGANSYAVAYAGYFNGNVNVNGVLTAATYGPSDQNLKTNINPILNSKSIISQLQPKHFYFDTTKYFLKGMNKKNYGLIAQDVQNVLPELVSTYHVADRKDSVGNIIATGGTFKTLNNNAFIGILLANAKEQNNRIDSLITALNSNARVINTSQPTASPTLGAISINKQNVTLSNADALVLDQNQPNPFSESTVIKYNVPEKYGYAQLIFTTIEGRILKTIDITKKGAGEITVYANDLSNGIYTYTLVVDGKTVDTKKMIKQN
jgi:hypothetical protein